MKERTHLSPETVKRLAAAYENRTGDIRIRATTVQGVEVVIVDGKKVFEKGNKPEEQKVAL
jgi:hypothetical protein